MAAMEPTQSNINHVNAIRGMALACQLPLHDFLSKLTMCEATMGPFGSRSIQGAGKRVRWAVFMADEVNKIRALISAKICSINLLLAIHASETLSRMEARAGSQQRVLLQNLEAHQRNLSSLSCRIEELKDEVATSHESSIGEVSDVTAEFQKRLNNISANTANNARSIASLSGDINSVQTSLISLRSLASQITAFLCKFPILQTNMRIYLLLLFISNKIGPSPTALIQSNIRFKDALGVVRSFHTNISSTGR